MTTFTTRANANSNASANEQKAQHFLNVYFQGKQIGYLVLDKFPQLVGKLQESEENATKLLQRCEGKYREAGVTKVEFDFDF